MDTPIIDPKTLPTWTAAGFVLALVALVFAMAGLYRVNQVAIATQTEVLALNKRINSTKPATAEAPAAPAVGSTAQK